MTGIEWATVAPLPDDLAQTARDLLDLAGDPSLVRTSGNGTTFEVPVSIADAYHDVKASEEAPAPPVRSTGKRGRAPRVPAPTEE